MPECQNCGKQFPKRLRQGDRIWNLASRRFCPDCSPLGRNNRRSYVVTTEPGKAFCARCQKSKDRSEFHTRKGGQKTLSYCRICSEEVKKLKLQEKLEKGVALKGGACVDCGGVFPVPVFQFVVAGKAILIGKIKNMSWERFRKQLEGCEMICLNCIAMRKWEKNDA